MTNSEFLHLGVGGQAAMTASTHGPGVHGVAGAEGGGAVHGPVEARRRGGYALHRLGRHGLGVWGGTGGFARNGFFQGHEVASSRQDDYVRLFAPEISSV